jgi:hypothetical protein
MLGAVSLRTPSHGRRYHVTIAKRFPEGENAAPHYGWCVEEVGPDGAPLPGGQRCDHGDTPLLRDPVAAYWAAVDSLCRFEPTTAASG